MKTMIYQVKVGKPPAFYDVCIDSVEKYCHKYGIDHVVQTEPILKIRPLKSHRSKQAVEKLGYLPIFEKEVAFNYLPDYNAIAIIDADIYIRNVAPNLFDELNEDVAFAGVLENEMPLKTSNKSKLKKYTEGQYGRLRNTMKKWHPKYGHPFYNMGMMLITNKLIPYLEGQTPEQFLRRNEFEKFINGEGDWRWSTDQTLLNYWVVKTGMKTQELSWKWNALVNAVEDKYLMDAYFFHFFLAAKHQKNGTNVLNIIKKYENANLPS